MEKFDESKYKNDFAKKKYDRIALFVAKGKRTQIDEFRKEKGYSPLNAYINDLIDK